MSRLTRTPVIWALFAATLAIGASFAMATPVVGGTFLDMLMTGAASREVIGALTDDQRIAHFWITVLLDTVYPLAYGGLLAAMALRFFGKAGGVAAAPAFATILVDLAENTVQALALAGAADMLSAKDVLTPLKFGLFGLAVVIALAALAVAIFRIARQTQPPPESPKDTRP